MRFALLLLVPCWLAAQEASASLTGALVDPDGGYIAYATVELDSGTKKYQGQADDRGVYRFSNLPAGEYALTFRMTGFRWFTLKSIELSQHEQKRLPDISLDVGPSACYPYPSGFLVLADDAYFGSLAGMVNGATEVDVTLVCRTFSRCRSTKTDSNGRFSFSMLSPGEYGLSFRHEGFYPIDATGYFFHVRAGLESVYGPVTLERCADAACDAKLRPPPQIRVCE
jgi:hypothetical protein